MTPTHEPSLSMSKSRAKYSTKNCGREKHPHVSKTCYLTASRGDRTAKGLGRGEGSGRLLVAPPVCRASERPRRGCGASRGPFGQQRRRSGRPVLPSRSRGSGPRTPSGKSCRRLRSDGAHISTRVDLCGGAGAQRGPARNCRHHSLDELSGPLRTCSGEGEPVVLELDDSLRSFAAHVLRRAAEGPPTCLSTFGRSWDTAPPCVPRPDGSHLDGVLVTEPISALDGVVPAGKRGQLSSGSIPPEESHSAWRARTHATASRPSSCCRGRR